MGLLFPCPDERGHLSRFYLATFFSEATNLSLPFRIMLAERTLGIEWLGPLLIVEQGAALLLDVPTGAWADHFGRKRCVLLGHTAVMLGLLFVPSATLVGGALQVALFMLSFALHGVSAALFSGAYESWVVDNLRFHGRRDLTARYFGRERSVAYCGGVLANVTAFAATYLLDFDVRWFWLIGALGELLAIGVLWRIGEHPRPGFAQSGQDAEGAEDEVEADDGSRPGIKAILREGVRGLAAKPYLMGLSLMLIWFSSAFGVGIETIQAGLSEGDLAKYGFSGLELVVDGLGALVAMAAVALAARCGARQIMAASVLLPAIVGIACGRSGNLGLSAGYVLAQLCACFLYTISDEERHRLLPSSSRATASSAMNLMTNLAQVGSAALLWLLTARLDCSAVQAIAVMGACALPAAIFLYLPYFRDSSFRTDERGGLVASGRNSNEHELSPTLDMAGAAEGPADLG